MALSAVVLEVVTHDGMALENASEALRADRDVVDAAERQNPRSTQFAAPELQADERLAVWSDWTRLGFLAHKRGMRLPLLLWKMVRGWAVVIGLVGAVVARRKRRTNDRADERVYAPDEERLSSELSGLRWDMEAVYPGHLAEANTRTKHQRRSPPLVHVGKALGISK